MGTDSAPASLIGAVKQLHARAQAQDGGLRTHFIQLPHSQATHMARTAADYAASPLFALTCSSKSRISARVHDVSLLQSQRRRRQWGV